MFHYLTKSVDFLNKHFTLLKLPLIWSSKINGLRIIVLQTRNET